MQRRRANASPNIGRVGDSLGFGIDGLAPTLRVVTPVWNQAPLDWIERAFACLVVLSNDQQLLARRSVVARANVAHPTVANVEAFNDGEAKWS